MRFILKGIAAVMLFLGGASAYEKKDHIANELSALTTMIDEMEEPKADSMFDRLVERKDQIASLAENYPQFSQRYQDELETLASMIDAIEDEDFDVCMQLIEERKDKLMTELTFSLFGDVEIDSAENMIKIPKLDGNAKAAHESYNKALVNFYNALPMDGKKPGKYQQKMQDLATLLDEAWQAYVKMVGKDNAAKLEYMDPTTFTNYFVKAEKAHDAANNAKLKKEEAEAAKKEGKEGDKDKDKKDKDKKLMVLKEQKAAEKTVDPEKDGFKELKKVKEAGETFENAIHNSVKELAKDTRYSQYYPYDDKKIPNDDQPANQDKFSGEAWSAYTTAAGKGGVDNTKLVEAYKKFKEVQEPLGKFIKKTKSIQNLMASEYFQEYFFVGLVLKKEMPAAADMKKSAEKAPNNKVLKAAAELLSKITEEERKEFNKLWGALLKQVVVLSEQAVALDESLTKFAGSFKSDVDEENAANKYSMVPVDTRASLKKVYESLQGFKKKVKKANEQSEQYQEVKKKIEKNGMGIVLVVLLLLGSCCAVGVCKWQGWCCFGEKEEEHEGGEPVRSDRKIFKKEVKSKNSHKRHAKESLVPSFKVAEEEA